MFAFAPDSHHLLPILLAVLPQSFVAALIARRKGHNFWRWFLLGIGITIGSGLLALLAFVYGGAIGRLVAIAVVLLAAPIIALFLKRKEQERPVAHQPVQSPTHVTPDSGRRGS